MIVIQTVTQSQAVLKVHPKWQHLSPRPVNKHPQTSQNPKGPRAQCLPLVPKKVQVYKGSNAQVWPRGLDWPKAPDWSLLSG